MSYLDDYRVYPPLVKTAQPAFDIADGFVKVHFSYTSYNGSASAISAIHFTVRDQITNKNVLSKTKWPYGIAVLDKGQIYQDTDNFTQFNNYIMIRSSDLQSGFTDSTNYKVQLRFSSKGTESGQTTYNASYFETNLSSFSEWSTVTLIRPIIAPTLVFNPDIPEDDNTGEIPTKNVGDNLVATYYPGEASNQRYVESLKSYRIRILDYKTQEVLTTPIGDVDTGEVQVPSYDYTDQYVIRYAFPIVLVTNESYSIEITIETRNGYKRKEVHSFVNTNASDQNFNNDGPNIEVNMNAEEGYINILFTTTETLTTNVTMRRTSSKSNFVVWEDVSNLTVENEAIRWSFNDFSVESGVIYKYGFQKRDIYGRRGTLYQNCPNILCEYENDFLTEKSLVEVYDKEGNLISKKVKQLKLKFDSVMSSFKYQVGESKTETIGSKYPYIRRNGSMYYRTFPISGLITRFMDEGYLFITSKAELRGGNDSELQYEAFFENRLVNDYDKHPSVLKEDHQTTDTGIYFQYEEMYDYSYERLFREAVEEFLYNGTPKAFRSETEGVILVKLMDVNLTPKQQLGRLLYSFSATAYEIDEPTLENFEKYGIQEIGTYQTNIEFNKAKIKQISSFDHTKIAGGTNIKDLIDQYEHVGETYNGTVTTASRLNWLRIEMESEPYLVDPITLTPIDDDDTFDREKCAIGWVIKIDGIPILISPPNNIYEMKAENVSVVSSVTPLRDCVMTIDYVVQLAQVMDTSNVSSIVEPRTEFGQLFRTFTAEEDILSHIYRRYRRRYDNVIQKVSDVSSINIETYPGSVFYVTTTGSSSQFTKRIVVNHTGNYYIDPGTENIITGLYFKGRAFYKDDLNMVAPSAEGYYPKEMDCDGTAVFYRGAWRKILNDVGEFYDIDLDIDTIVDYVCNITKGYV